jgi:hypothetical protein
MTYAQELIAARPAPPAPPQASYGDAHSCPRDPRSLGRPRPRHAGTGGDGLGRGEVSPLRPTLSFRSLDHGNAGRPGRNSRRHPLSAARLCADVEQPRHRRHRLFLCLCLPRHPAAGPTLPHLLRPSAASGRNWKPSASGGSFREAWYCGLLSLTLSTPLPTRRKSCAAQSRAYPAVSMKERAALGLFEECGAPQDHPAAGADRRASTLRERDHPADQGLGPSSPS